LSQRCLYAEDRRSLKRPAIVLPAGDKEVTGAGMVSLNIMLDVGNIY
jgi:hypothetical protein